MNCYDWEEERYITGKSALLVGKHSASWHNSIKMHIGVKIVWSIEKE